MGGILRGKLTFEGCIFKHLPSSPLACNAISLLAIASFQTVLISHTISFQ